LTWLKRQKSREFRQGRGGLRSFAAEKEGLPPNLIRTCLRANYDGPSLQGLNLIVAGNLSRKNAGE
jgi:hypothetical protein